MKIVAVIPARAGSVRLPHKNILDLGGKPLVEWTMIAARQAKTFGKIIVSTDDDAVAELARSYDMTIVLQPQIRQDAWASFRVIEHAIKARWGSLPENVMLLQPTSPFRTARHIREAWSDFTKPRHRHYDSLVSVNPNEQVNGAIYLFSTDRILRQDPLYDDGSLRYEMEAAASIDIDTLADLEAARRILGPADRSQENGATL